MNFMPIFKQKINEHLSEHKEQNNKFHHLYFVLKSLNPWQKKVTTEEIVC